MIGSPLLKHLTMLHYEGARIEFEKNAQFDTRELSFSIEVTSNTTDEVL